jgi:hypothetical protein
VETHSIPSLFASHHFSYFSNNLHLLVKAALEVGKNEVWVMDILTNEKKATLLSLGVFSNLLAIDSLQLIYYL